jgi:OOP family OmpA-OmpF porin
MSLKKSLLSSAVLGVVFLGISSQAFALNEGFYGAINLSVVDQKDDDFSYAPGAKIDTSFDTGYGLSGSYGYDTGKVWSLGGLRPEIEVGYNKADVDGHRLNGGSTLNGSKGDITNFYVMANLIHDFDTGTAFVPYLGGGLGYANVSYNDFGVSAIPDVLDDSGGAFAYQGIAGLGFEVSENITLTLDYRYFSTDSVDVKTAVGNNTSLKSEQNKVNVGMRYGF